MALTVQDLKVTERQANNLHSLYKKNEKNKKVFEEEGIYDPSQLYELTRKAGSELIRKVLTNR